MCGLGVMFALYYILLEMQRGGSIEIQDRLPFLGRRVCAGYFHARGPLPVDALPAAYLVTDPQNCVMALPEDPPP